MTLKQLFPALHFAPLTSNIRGDLRGALQAILVCVPQAIAGGLIAVSTLGPEWAGAGILAGLLSTAAAALLAGVLGAGPISIVAPSSGVLVLFAGLVASLREVPDIGTPDAIALAGLALAVAGLIHALLGVARLGRLADFVPYPVLAGFINATGLEIAKGEIKPLLGMSEQTEWARALTAINPGAALLGLATVLVMFLAPRITKRVPPLILGLAAGTAVYHVLPLTGLDFSLGDCLPPPERLRFGLVSADQVLSSVVGLPMAAIATVTGAILSMVALSALDVVFTTLGLDLATGRRTSANRELVTQGVAVGLAGLLGLLPCAVGIGRTMAAERAGGRTALATFFYAAIMAAVGVFLTPAARFIPEPVMAAVLTVIGLTMIDRWSLGVIRRLRPNNLSRLPSADMLAMTAVVASALIYDLVTAVGVGIGVTVLFLVIRISRSPIRRQYPATALAARVQDDPERFAFTHGHGHEISIIELEGVLFFGSVAAVQRQVEHLIERGVRHVVLDLKRVRDLDITAARTLEWLHTLLDRVGGLLVLAYVDPERRWEGPGGFRGQDRRERNSFQRRIWRVLEQVGAVHVFSRSQLAIDLDHALIACEDHMRAERTLAGGDLPGSLILRGLDRLSMRQLRPYLSRKRFEIGDSIFRQGDPPDSIYFIAAGRVDITIDLPRTDRKLRVRSLAQGAIFGEMAIIDPKPRSAYVTAAKTSICYRLSAEDFERLKREESELALRLMANTALVFAERLRVSNMMIAELEV